LSIRELPLDDPSCLLVDHTVVQSGRCTHVLAGEIEHQAVRCRLTLKEIDDRAPQGESGRRTENDHSSERACEHKTPMPAAPLRATHNVVPVALPIVSDPVEADV